MPTKASQTSNSNHTRHFDFWNSSWCPSPIVDLGKPPFTTKPGARVCVLRHRVCAQRRRTLDLTFGATASIASYRPMPFCPPAWPPVLVASIQARAYQEDPKDFPFRALGEQAGGEAERRQTQRATDPVWDTLSRVNGACAFTGSDTFAISFRRLNVSVPSPRSSGATVGHPRFWGIGLATGIPLGSRVPGVRTHILGWTSRDHHRLHILVAPKCACGGQLVASQTGARWRLRRCEWVLLLPGPGKEGQPTSTYTRNTILIPSHPCEPVLYPHRDPIP